jgi:hypothetical protein
MWLLESAVKFHQLVGFNPQNPAKSCWRHCITHHGGHIGASGGDDSRSNDELASVHDEKMTTICKDAGEANFYVEKKLFLFFVFCVFLTLQENCCNTAFTFKPTFW